MKLQFVTGLFLTTVLTVACKAKLESDKDKISYMVGSQIGEQLKQQGVEVDPKVVAMAIGDVLGGKKSQLDEKEMMATMQKLREQSMKKQKEMAEKAKADAVANNKKGEEFLEKNAKKEGIKKTESGLQYEVITAGKGGKKPKATDKVEVHYKGTLLDGTEFDSSYKRGETAKFGLNQVIPGWTEGLQLMEVGSKYKFYIPSKLGYGDRAQSKIPAGSLLVFEVELKDIVTK